MRSIILSLVLVLFLSSCQQIYFMLTTMAASPTSDTLYAPETAPTSIQSVDPKNIVTLLIYKNNGIYGYMGKNIASGKKYSYDTNSIRVFLKKSKRLLGDQLFVEIKSCGTATNNNTVDMLDELTIGEIKKYVLIDATSSQKAFINSLN